MRLLAMRADRGDVIDADVVAEALRAVATTIEWSIADDASATAHRAERAANQTCEICKEAGVLPSKTVACVLHSTYEIERLHRRELRLRARIRALTLDASKKLPNFQKRR